jgi:hypothetical protein
MARRISSYRVVDVEGLGQVFERAPLKRRNRGLQVGVRGHDDDRQSRMLFLDRRKQLEPGGAGHANVGNQHLRGILGERLDAPPAPRHTDGRECFHAQGLFEHPANGLVVIDDPDRFHGFPHLACATHTGGPQASNLRTTATESSKHRVSGRAVTFDRAVVLLHEGLRQGQSRPASALPSGYQWIEDAIANGLGYTRSVVLEICNSSANLYRSLRKRDLSRDAGLETNSRIGACLHAINACAALRVMLSIAWISRSLSPRRSAAKRHSRVSGESGAEIPPPAGERTLSSTSWMFTPVICGVPVRRQHPVHQGLQANTTP